MGKHRDGPRIPPAHEGVQVNFCKSPICGNFGTPASEEKQPRGRGAAEYPDRDGYRLGTSEDGRVRLTCLKNLTLKSNRAIHEETARFLAYLTPPAPQTTCSTPDCPNGTVPVDAPRAPYQR